MTLDDWLAVGVVALWCTAVLGTTLRLRRENLPSPRVHLMRPWGWLTRGDDPVLFFGALCSQSHMTRRMLAAILATAPTGAVVEPTRRHQRWPTGRAPRWLNLTTERSA